VAGEQPRSPGTTKLPTTLTEAQIQSGVVYVLSSHESSYSSARVITYAERYRAFNGILETPIQHIQKAAEDESKRRRVR
jgi:hypothetical protein